MFQFCVVGKVHVDTHTLDMSICYIPTAKAFNTPQHPSFPAVRPRECQLQMSSGTNASAPRWRASTIHNANIQLPDIAARSANNMFSRQSQRSYSRIGVRVLSGMSTDGRCCYSGGGVRFHCLNAPQVHTYLLWRLFLSHLQIAQGGVLPALR